ncbi:MAG TPA: glutaredoxin family protein [Acidobacteriota bacterium]
MRLLRPLRPRAAAELPPSLIEIYVGGGCHLCEEALAVLERVQHRIPFRLVTHSVESRPEWERAHRGELPVVFIDGKKAFKFRIDPAELERRLRRRRG